VKQQRGADESGRYVSPALMPRRFASSTTKQHSPSNAVTIARCYRDAPPRHGLDVRMTPPRFIVTGMHRSGTSFVASLLSAWNVRIGDRLLPADRGNPHGYFEDAGFLDLDRRMLVACTP